MHKNEKTVCLTSVRIIMLVLSPPALSIPMLYACIHSLVTNGRLGGWLPVSLKLEMRNLRCCEQTERCRVSGKRQCACSSPPFDSALLQSRQAIPSKGRSVGALGFTYIHACFLNLPYPLLSWPASGEQRARQQENRKMMRDTKARGYPLSRQSAQRGGTLQISLLICTGVPSPVGAGQNGMGAAGAYRD